MPQTNDAHKEFDGLTERQKEILRLIAAHRQAKEIARILNISVPTVKDHTAAARKRLGMTTSRDAALYLVAYESQHTTLPEGGHPPSIVSKPDPEMPSLPHGRQIPPQRRLHADQLPRTRDGLDTNISAPEDAIRARHGANGQSIEQEYRPREGVDDLDHSNRLADGGVVSNGTIGRFKEELKRLSPLRWTLLMIALALTMTFVVVAFASALIGLLELLRHVNQYFLGHE